MQTTTTLPGDHAAPEAEVTGYLGPLAGFVVSYLAGKAIDAYIENATPVWSDQFPAFPSGGQNPVPGGSPYGSNGTKLQ